MSTPDKNDVELLAPAGSFEALLAAVNNGADAVYLGTGELNARRGAENFDLEAVAAATRFAHLRGVRVYVTVNVVVLPDEMPRAVELVDRVWAAGADAVIVQDLGLLRVLRTELPDVRVHASTQIDAMNPQSVEALAAAGAARVTLARELPLDGIAACAATGVEVETFVHGALCYSYSGQCLMSSLIGQRSANRGLCAQPCRLPYDLLDPDGSEVTAPGRYLLSMRDLAGLERLPALIQAGVRALKIEGRMKAPEYVAIVTGVYRSALDRALADPEGFSVTSGEWELLEEAFSRGFTDGYLSGVRGAPLMSYSRPNNRGVLVGRVVKAEGRSARVALERSLDASDTIEVWTSRGRVTQPAGPLSVDGRPVTTAPAGTVAELAIDGALADGDRVFRVVNAAMVDAARRTFVGSATADQRPTPVSFDVTVRVGEPLRLTAEADGVRVVAEGPVVEPARTKPVTVDEIVEHVGRLGGSGYRAESWNVTLDAQAGLGYAALHALRREALGLLDDARLAPWAGRRFRGATAPELRGAGRWAQAVTLVATTFSSEQAEACRAEGADAVFLRVFGSPSEVPLPEGVRPLLPRVVWPDELDALAEWFDGAPVLVGNLGLIAPGASAGEVWADWPLNVVNAYAAAELRDMGARFVWASPELAARQLADVVSKAPVPLGYVVWGRLELMVAENCVLRAAGECAGTCATCARRRRWWRLRDRKGYEFPVITDASGRSHIMNSVTLDLLRSLDDVLATGISAVRLDFSDEPPEQVARVVRRARSALEHALSGVPLPASGPEEAVTTGHFYRGVR